MRLIDAEVLTLSPMSDWVSVYLDRSCVCLFIFDQKKRGVSFRATILQNNSLSVYGHENDFDETLNMVKHNREICSFVLWDHSDTCVVPSFFFSSDF